jgi:hypothetical protein
MGVAKVPPPRPSTSEPDHTPQTISKADSQTPPRDWRPSSLTSVHLHVLIARVSIPCSSASSNLVRQRLHTLLARVFTFDRRRPRNAPPRQASVILTSACLHVLITRVSIPCSPASSNLDRPRLHLRSPASTRTPPRDGSGEGASPRPSTSEPDYVTQSPRGHPTNAPPRPASVIR